MSRIALAGLMHETNTFAAGTAKMADFEAPGGWPPLVRGDALPAALASTSTPMSGALKVLAEAGGEPVPLLWTLALPSGPVDHTTFEALAGEIVERLAAAHAARPVDGVFLDLHGAMVTTACDDGEAEILARVRAVVGPAVPVAASLDAHANISPRMVRMADHLDIFRTYPHVDMPETGGRAMARLLDIVARGRPYAKAFRAVPFLTSIVMQSTLDAPTDGLVASGLARAETVPGGSLSQAFGFPLADIADVGPSIVAYAESEADAEAMAEAQLAEWLAAEAAFGAEMLTSAEAASRAIALAAGSGSGPVVIADAQDNPGGGGTSETTGLLRALIEAGTEDVLFVHISDEAAAARAHAAGVGGICEGPLGGAMEPEFGAPLGGPFRVIALGDGAFTGEGPMYRGNAIRLGPVALMETGGVRVIVAGRPMQASEPGLPRHLGIDPFKVSILAVKSSVHFRGAYGTAARAVLIAKAPGRVAIDLADLTYTKARRRIAGTA